MKFHLVIKTVKSTICACLYMQFLFGCNMYSGKNNAEIQFKTQEISFGNVEHKNDTCCSYKFINSGNTPLLIIEVKSNCGCTVPNWTEKPILPGEAGEIKVYYDAENLGYFFKTIQVYYNGKSSPQTLFVKGEVYKKIRE
jgi:hypothetical protein